jgi:hypothetical protein
LSEGIYYIGPSIRTLHPKVRRLRVNDAVAFQATHVIDDYSEIDDYIGMFDGGVVSPHFKWDTQFKQSGT